MFKRKNLIFSSMVLAVAVAGITACSKSSDSVDGGGSVALSEFATLLAEDMTLASPTAKSSTAVIVKSKSNADGGFEVFTGPDATDSAKEKSDGLKELLKETPPATCNIALTLQQSSRANCYGPSVNFTGHPTAPDGQFPGGDLGIWEDSEAGGEACVAAQLNIQMRGVASMVDMGQFIVAGMGCVAKKDSITLPSTASTSVDMTAAMAGKITVDGATMTVTSASIGRVADVTGFPVFVTTLNGTAGTKTIEVRLKHIPTVSDDSTNRGKISVKISNTAPNGTDGVSLEYEKLTTSTGKFLLKSINFGAAGQNPFTNYTVNYGAAWNNNANYFLGSMNTTDYTGQFAYAWQAGNGDSHTRVMNLIISNSSGTPTGTGFFGFGPQVQVGAGGIDGMICQWSQAGNSHAPVAKVQKQNIKFAAGKFEVDGTTNTTFDPVPACEAPDNMPMTWGASGTRNSNTTTENLAPLADVATTIGALPTAPTAVD